MRRQISPLSAVSISFIFFLLNPLKLFAQNIQLTESLIVDPAAKFQVIPRSFCVTEGMFFLLPDSQTGTMKIFLRKGNFLKFSNTLGPRLGKEVKFVRPMYCFYSRDEGKLGVIDYGIREVFIFNKTEKGGFTWLKNIPCQRGGYDILFSGNGRCLVISGFIANRENKPFDLYSINIKTGGTDFLLPSPQKYGEKTFEGYFLEYRQKKILPAIGTRAFIDIYGDDLFFVWEGALRIIRINLCSREQMIFGQETSYYTRPDGYTLVNPFKKGDLKSWAKAQEKMAYISDIFVTTRHVFLVYKTAKNEKCNASPFRLQIYTPGGNYLEDILIPGTPGPQMWFDKENYELHAFSEKPGDSTNDGEFSILKYKISI